MLIDDGAVLYRHVKTAEGRDECAQRYMFVIETQFRVKVIDTWNMTVEDRGVFKGKFKVELPGKPYMAIQIKKIQ